MEIFEHVGITVRSLSRSINFYNRLLDSEPFQSGVIEGPSLPRLVGADVERLSVAFYRLPGTRTALELVECHPGADSVVGGLDQPGQVHLCFFVESMERAAETLLSLGITAPEPIALPGHEGNVVHTLFVRDLDGTPLQLVSTSNGEPRF